MPTVVTNIVENLGDMAVELTKKKEEEVSSKRNNWYSVDRIIKTRKGND